MNADVSAVSAPPSDDSTKPAGSGRGQHWCAGRYFVPVPDLNDETRWAISEGSAWPAFIAILGAAHDLERRGRTREIRDDAYEGRIEIGVSGLAKASGYGEKAVLRQLRHLERVVGIIRTHQGTFTTERDSKTGRVIRNHAKAPPKVIIITIQDGHMRPDPTRRPPAGVAVETTGTSNPVGIETTGKGNDPRDRNDVVPIDRTLHRGFGQGDRTRRTAAAGHEGRAPRPPQREPRPAPPARGQDRHALDRRDRLAAEYAYNLGMEPAEVIDLWRRDPAALKTMLLERGIDPTTGRRMKGATVSVVHVAPATETARPPDTTFEIRRATTAAVSMRDEPPAAEVTEDEERRREQLLATLKRATEEDIRKAVRIAPETSKGRAGRLGRRGRKAVSRAARASG